MKFFQYEDGSCDIKFEPKEVEIINRTNKLYMSDVALRHFGNSLIKMVADWNNKFNERLQNEQTLPDTKIEGGESKDVSSK
tara:strand:+ start:3064 stop:3306 length:243 start_codon:yes stop_codon:yes gene_type:complete